MRSVALRARTAATMVRLLPLYLTFGLLKPHVSLQRLAQWAWTPARSNPVRGEQERIVGCVVRLRQLLRVIDTDCVPRSLILYRELSRLGRNPRLCVGFKNSGTTLEGHAWIEVDGRAIGEPDPAAAGFQRRLSFAADGELAA
ncbi:MAG: lasso peptide biosynthesis B2 protein [Vicinamibacterales bacterium]